METNTLEGVSSVANKRDIQRNLPPQYVTGLAWDSANGSSAMMMVIECSELGLSSDHTPYPVHFD